MKGVKIKN